MNKISAKLSKREQLKILQAVLAILPSEYEKITKKKEKANLESLEKNLNEQF